MRTRSEKADEPKKPARRAPARSLEARENQLIAKAFDEAERLIDRHEATSQILTELMKRGSTKERLEKEVLEQRRELDRAKIEALKTQQNIEALYEDAIQAMRTYNGESKKAYDD